MLDICLVIPLAWGLVRGLYKGLLLSVGSLIGLVLGIYVANIYSTDLTKFMLSKFVLSENIAHVIAYFLIFAGVTLVTFFVAKILDKFFKVVMLSWLNRLLGAIFGILKYALVISVILNLLSMVDGYVQTIPEQRKKESILYEPLYKLVPTVLPYVNFYVVGDGK